MNKDKALTHEALKYATEFNAPQFWGDMSAFKAICELPILRHPIVLKTKLFMAARKLHWASDPFGDSSDTHFINEVLEHYQQLHQPIRYSGDGFTRFTGSLYGLILGDICGSYFEFSDRGPKSIPSLGDLTNQKNIFGMEFGYTDDTILTLLAIDAFIEDAGELNPVSQLKAASSYLSETTAWSPSGTCFDIGTTTRKSLISPNWPGKKLNQNSGNGVLMKLAPYAYSRLFCEDTSLGGYYFTVANLTHGSASTILTATVMGLALEQLYLGVDWQVARKAIIDAPPISHVLDLDRTYKGFCEDSLYLAFHLMDQGVSWDKGLQIIFDLGGDTDTNAAIFGQLYGAQHPEEVIDRYNAVKAKIHRSDEIDSQTLKLNSILTSKTKQHRF